MKKIIFFIIFFLIPVVKPNIALMPNKALIFIVAKKYRTYLINLKQKLFLRIIFRNYFFDIL